MKLFILSSAILFLIAGITLGDNSFEVSGQSPLDEARKILGTTANTTANATGELMSRADNVLSLGSDARSNATQTAKNKTMNLLSDLHNSISNEVLNTSSNLTEPINAATNKGVNETSHTYENTTEGIRFQYPSDWRQLTDDIGICNLGACPVEFFITVPKLDTATNTSLNYSECGGNEPKGLLEVNILTIEKCDAYKMILDVYELDKPANVGGPCDCSTLKDFVTWDYTRGDKRNTFINDNQTIIGSNYSAWQMEEIFSSSSVKEKWFRVWAINDNFGYRFLYTAPADARFDRYLDGFKNMLKSVTFSPPIPEKKPSFLNSSDPVNSTTRPSMGNQPIKIASSNDFIDSIGYLHVVGEVENNSPSNIQFVKVSGTFYDSNNQVVATDFTYTNPSDIGPGGKAPFDLTLLSASIPISQIDHYNLQVTYD